MVTSIFKNFWLIFLLAILSACGGENSNVVEADDVFSPEGLTHKVIHDLFVYEDEGGEQASEPGIGHNYEAKSVLLKTTTLNVDVADTRIKFGQAYLARSTRETSASVLIINVENVSLQTLCEISLVGGIISGSNSYMLDYASPDMFLVNNMKKTVSSGELRNDCLEPGEKSYVYSKFSTFRDVDLINVDYVDAISTATLSPGAAMVKEGEPWTSAIDTNTGISSLNINVRNSGSISATRLLDSTFGHYVLLDESGQPLYAGSLNAFGKDEILAGELTTLEDRTFQYHGFAKSLVFFGVFNE